jgi:Flp pilus assembly protein TadD
MRTRAITTLTAAALLLALTACSSNDDTPAASDSGSPAPEQTTEVPAAHEADDLKAAVAVYTAAYFDGNADTAYGMLSARCSKKISPTAYASVVEQAKKDYGPDHPATDVQADVSGKLARVSYKVKGLPKFDQQAQPWALEGDSWKFDAC